MALRALVKVSEITNLSDARYCAGMGVEMIGFSLDENHPKFMDISKVLEISNWVSGIKVVGEFNGSNYENINYLGEQLNVHYIQLEYSKLHAFHFNKIKIPIILKIDLDHETSAEALELIEKSKDEISIYILKKVSYDSTLRDLIFSLKEKVSLILETDFNAENLITIVSEIHPVGINLKGGDEIRPGLKDFSALSDLLELLEEENN